MLIVAFTAVKSNKGKGVVRTIKHSVNKMSILFKAFQWLPLKMALMITSKNFNRISNRIQ